MRAFWVAGVLFAFAAVLAIDPLPFRGEAPPDTAMPVWATDITPVRRPSLTPHYTAAVYTYRCSDCHAIIPSPEEPRRKLTQHTEIQLKHGINASCFNCHHPRNRDAFVDDFGGEIPWDQPQFLCAKCHGPVFRDWEHGSHGRANGYWDTAMGPQTRRKCIECHDPHQPPFPPMKPAPGPRTLRMGPQGHAGHPELYGPLRLRRHTIRAASTGAEQEGH